MKGSRWEKEQGRVNGGGGLRMRKGVRVNCGRNGAGSRVEEGLNV